MKYHSYFSMFVHDYGNSSPTIEGKAFVKVPKEKYSIYSSSGEDNPCILGDPPKFPLTQFHVGGKTCGEFLYELYKFSIGPTVSEMGHSSPKDDVKLEELNHIAKIFTEELDKRLKQLYPSNSN